MIFSDNAIMLNAIGAWKNANRLRNSMNEDIEYKYSTVSQI